jgi:hypothetical protein
MQRQLSINKCRFSIAEHRGEVLAGRLLIRVSWGYFREGGENLLARAARVNSKSLVH